MSEVKLVLHEQVEFSRIAKLVKEQIADIVCTIIKSRPSSRVIANCE